ncbi:LysR family transcriptional regulator [Kyrpidia tusciae]|uniref:Transcriptional regulator, LysR family n=1 Tax=Kyrpidia tusciae (strain DSM 2912 / NBRC 15312 / T2) TaxID=562970 RepID=D5WWC6_KYRT2|nr:LysR family transcriptional regulator [Kyrpidia tusciae]ADG07691.1 transcriptional regulator, LysR family [Kyrpidia tusciae DSM 2912]
MNLDQLLTFIEVEKTRNFSRAAENLFLPQPTLSNRIRSLEQELGGQLFERDSRGVRLTEFGKMALPYVASIVSQWAELNHNLRNYRENLKKTFRIGIPFAFFTSVMPRLLPRLIERFPYMSFSFTNILTSNIIDEIQNHAIDLGITAYEVVNPQIAFHKIDEQEVSAVMAPFYPLARQTDKSVSLAQVAAEPLVLFGKNTAYRIQIDNEFRKRQLRYVELIEINEINTIIGILKGGIGVSLLPNRFIEMELQTGELVSFPIRPEPMKPFQTFAAYSTVDSAKIPDIKSIIDEMTSFFSET